MNAHGETQKDGKWYNMNLVAIGDHVVGIVGIIINKLVITDISIVAVDGGTIVVAATVEVLLIVNRAVVVMGIVHVELVLRFHLCSDPLEAQGQGPNRDSAEFRSRKVKIRMIEGGGNGGVGEWGKWKKEEVSG